MARWVGWPTRIGTRAAPLRPARSSRAARRLRYELLEDRRLLAGVPFGAAPDDTAEFMLGDVLVTVVLMESSTNVSSVNPNTENWTPALIGAAKQRVQDGVRWWEQTLVTEFPNTVHHLNFQFDFTYADNPVLTDYEPISLTSDYFQYWIYDFLNPLGYNQTGQFSSDIRAFNHAQRLAHGTDWAFTIFVVNDAADGDGRFAYGGSFQQAFSFAGGQFVVSPAGRPASTFAHETGHMFWARDEYANAGSYTDRRGYYNAQNWNAANNPTPGFTQTLSIMRENPLDAAFSAHTSSPSSLAMIGWRDSDGDGVFDVLDVPHSLRGTGYFDPGSGQYRFVGESSVQTLPNLNSWGLQNDVTLNKISRAEYRIDGGAWQTAAVYGTPTAALDLMFPVSSSGASVVEIRTIDADTGVASPVFVGNTSSPASTLRPGINGFVWIDADADEAMDNAELRLAGWTVRLVDADGAPLNVTQTVEPDAFATGAVLNNVHPQARLSLDGDPSGIVIAAVGGSQKVFGSRSGTVTRSVWEPGGLGLRVDFTAPTTAVRLDAIGSASGSRARLDAYDAGGVLIGRYTTDALGVGRAETMRIERSTADIAYVIAKARGAQGVRLDSLRFGPETTTRTNAAGAYAITGLAAGPYFVEAVSPAGRVVAESRRPVVLTTGQAQGAVNLSAHTGEISWQNQALPTDVTGDGRVAPQDALVLINYINAHGGDQSVPQNDVPPPYYDVDGNGLITPADVLQVINELNRQSSGGYPAGERGAPFPASPPAPPAEGEQGAAPPSAAARPSSALAGVASIDAAPQHADSRHAPRPAVGDSATRTGPGTFARRSSHWRTAAAAPCVRDLDAVFDLLVADQIDLAPLGR